MAENDPKQDHSTSNLRQRAEQQLGPSTGSGQGLEPEETRRLLHELRVHQIELEMQNKELQRVHAELEASHSRYFDLFEMAPVGYVILNEPGLFLLANLTAAGLLGMERSALVKRPLTRFILPDDQDIYYLHRKQLFETGAPQVCELRMLKKDGAQIWVQLSATVAQDADGAPQCRVAISNITGRKQAEEALRGAKESLELTNRDLQTALAHVQQLARIDELTGVNNRRCLGELAEHEFAIAARYQHPVSVIMFDIDHFKLVNDRFGHAVGDQMLKHIVQVACTQLRKVDMIGRYGGEEFVIVLPVTNAQQAYPLAERIREGVAALRLDIGKGQVAVTVSIGIAEMRHASEDKSVESVIAHADKAMYAAKAAGRNCTSIYRAEMQAD